MTGPTVALVLLLVLWLFGRSRGCVRHYVIAETGIKGWDGCPANDLYINGKFTERSNYSDLYDRVMGQMQIGDTYQELYRSGRCTPRYSYHDMQREEQAVVELLYREWVV